MTDPATATPLSVLAGCQTRSDVATFLGTSNRYLAYILYGRRIRDHYARFTVPRRRGGVRVIEAPPRELKYFQRLIATALLTLYHQKPSVHGFVLNRSIASNANAHVRKRLLVNLDLRDFFGTITIGRLISVLQNPPFNLGREAAVVISQITFKTDGTLPQGAPSSPIISNILCRRLDTKLQDLAKRAGCTYTRYADDLTFSSTRPRLDPVILDTRFGNLVPSRQLRNAIISDGFKFNYKKFKICWSGERQFVTGLTVNETINLSRSFVRELDSLIHIWRKHGYASAQLSFRRHRRNLSKAGDHLRNVFRGKLAFFQMVKGVNDPVYRRLLGDLHELDPAWFAAPAALSPLLATALKGRLHARSDWTQVVETSTRSVQFARLLVDGKVHANASAFIVDHDLAITAGHIVKQDWEVALGWDVATGKRPKKIVAYNDRDGLDLAILQFEPNSFEPPFIPTECRVPCVGEAVAALGYPRVPRRDTTLVSHIGVVEALPMGFKGSFLFRQVFRVAVD